MTEAAPVYDLSLAIDSYPLIQGFTPLSSSRLWTLNEDYWNARGTAAFFQDAVPYVATNDGSLAEASVQVLAEYARDRAVLTVIEIGPGSGLFARAVIEGYSRARDADPSLAALRYVFIDCSETMLATLRRDLEPLLPMCEIAFLLGGFPADADLRAALMDRIAPGAGAICIANYALDSLAAAMVCSKEGEAREVEVEIRDLPDDARSGAADISSLIIRSRVGENLYTGIGAELVSSDLPDEGSFLPVNSGAMETIAMLSDLDGRVTGFLVNDYAVEPGAMHFEPFQYFGSSVALGLNFDLLDRFVGARDGWVVAVPRAPSDQIVSRLYANQPSSGLLERFAEAFSFEGAKTAHENTARARTARRSGQHGRALAFYESAMQASGRNWSLLLEVGEFLLNALNETDGAMAMAQRAITANPYSAEAYNLIGECHFGAGDIGSARQSYEHAHRLKSSDARSLLNLAYCDARDGALAAALGRIAEALAADRAGVLTSELLERQRELIERVQSKR